MSTKSQPAIAARMKSLTVSEIEGNCDARTELLQKISGPSMAAALKAFGNEYMDSMKQPSLKEEEALLVLTCLAHTSTWASKMMNGVDLRVIQNCKIHGCERLLRSEDELLAVVRSLPEDSLLRQMCTTPGEFAQREFGTGSEEYAECVERTNKLLQFIRGETI